MTRVPSSYKLKTYADFTHSPKYKLKNNEKKFLN